MRRQALSLLVENNPGVTSRISGLFSRRGYNIDSFSSGVTADPKYTRITIVASGDELILDQIEKQLLKLEDVLDIKKLEPGFSVTRELILVKIRAKDTERQPIMNVTEIFHGKIVDVTNDSMVIQLVGHQDKLDAFLDLKFWNLRVPELRDLPVDRRMSVFWISYGYLLKIFFYIRVYIFRRTMICQKQEFFIRKIVTFHYWMERQSQSSAMAARDMHMH